MSTIITRAHCPCCGSTLINKVCEAKDHTVSKEIFEIWECDDCSIRFTQNIPSQDAIGPYYKSDTYISHSDTEKGFVNKAYKIARNYTLDWKMKMINSSLGKEHQGGSLLDIGSGTGAFLHKAKEQGWIVKGLEPDEGARGICNEKYGIQSETPGKLFEFPPGYFDVVTMWHVLEHVHELHAYMDQVKKILKPGGVALIALPNYTSLDATKYRAYWAAYDVPRHLYHFSPGAMNKLAGQHQMMVMSEKPMWLDAFYIALLSETYQHGKSNLVSAFWNGMSSNLYAIRKRDACSSLVYILRHG